MELLEKTDKALSSIYVVMKESLSQTDTEVTSEFLNQLTESSKASIDVMSDITSLLKENKIKLPSACIDKINEFYDVVKVLPKSSEEVVSGKDVIDMYMKLICSAFPVIMIANEFLKTN